MSHWIEITILAFATLIIPFIIWIVHQLKQSIFSHVNLLLNEYYTGLDDQIKYNCNELEKLKTRLKHRAEISCLKYTALELTIEDIELYLEKVNGYRRRNRISHLKKCSFPQEKNEENYSEDDLSMGF